MCTVLLRWSPGTAWPVLLGAVRDEFTDRGWDPPGRHWDAGPPGGSAPAPAPSAGGSAAAPGRLAGGSAAAPGRRLVGGRDRTAGGTWLAVDPDRPAVAAVLNGPRLPLAPGVPRPSRGGLPLAALRGGFRADPAALAGFDGFHLLYATPARAVLWSWDGATVHLEEVPPGDHVLVNDGMDTDTDPLVPHVLPLLRKAGMPDPRPGPDSRAAWDEWIDLLAGDGLPPGDPRALLVRVPVGERAFASTSACLVALRAGMARFDFTAAPGPAAPWSEVPLA